VRADFYNPFSQFLIKATNPPLNLLRRVIPGLGGIDLSSLILAWILASVELLLVILISGNGVYLLAPLLWAIPELVETIINIFLFSVFIQALLSWFVSGGYNPVYALLDSLTAPMLRPARRILPPTGGFDLSPILAIIGLILLKMLLIPPLRALTGSPFGGPSFL
jgi:YggT family protein